jgi:hypothetical protein
VGDVALEVPLGSFTFGGLGQRHHLAEPGIQGVGDATDRAPLAGGVPALEDDHQLVSAVTDPFQHLHQFQLEISQFVLVVLLGELPVGHGS